MAEAGTRLVFPALGGIYSTVAPITEPLIRAVAGLSLAMHGQAILFGDHEAFAAFFERSGFSPGLFWAMATATVQFVGGLCLAAGFLTRLAAVPVFVFLLTAIHHHLQSGFYWDIKGFEYPLFWAIVVLHFIIHGGGRWSIDAMIGREV